MSNLIIDLTNAEEKKDLKLLPKGDYDARVDEVTFQHSKKSGRPMLKWAFELIDIKHQGRKIFMYTLLDADFGISALKQIISAIGLPITKQFNPQSFAEKGEAINKLCVLKVVQKKQKKGDYAGEMQNQIRDVLPAQGNKLFNSEHIEGLV